MKEKEARERLQHLSEIREKAISLVEEYNEKAKEINCLERMALLVSSFDSTDFDDDKIPSTAEELEEMMNDFNSNLSGPSLTYSYIESGWFPSDLNC